MNWLGQLSKAEYLYIAAFLVCYLGYFVQMFITSRKIKISFRRLLLKFFLRTSYFTLFIIALLGPSFGDIKKEIKDIGKDIYIAIDLSASMDANDVAPSRLEKVKFEIAGMLKYFNSDRVGLIIFSEEAYVQCPLTYDHDAVGLFLESLNKKLREAGGTDLNTPLEKAYERFSQDKNENIAEPAKVLILVTDGENFSEQPPDELIRRLQKAGVSLFIVGVGSREGGVIPVMYGPKKNSTGNVIITKLNAAGLTDFAELAGGKYFEISPDANETKQLVNHVLNVEGILKGSRKIESAANKYFYFLFVAATLLILDIVVTFKTIHI